MATAVVGQKSTFLANEMVKIKCIRVNNSGSDRGHGNGDSVGKAVAHGGASGAHAVPVTPTPRVVKTGCDRNVLHLRHTVSTMVRCPQVFCVF